jgi:hypothetical protein
MTQIVLAPADAGARVIRAIRGPTNNALALTPFPSNYPFGTSNLTGVVTSTAYPSRLNSSWSICFALRSA